jgi:CRP-like cAMP-binding protein
MSDTLASFIQSIHPLPAALLQQVKGSFRQLRYPKYHLLLRPGRICTALYFTERGAARYFYTDETGKETNVWFSFEGELIADALSFTRQLPSEEGIQLLEDGELYAIDYTDIQRLLREQHAFALWYIRMLEQHYIPQIEDRVTDLQFLNARQRYEKLLHRFPDITNRISLGHIASFLNITQETLSRIRAAR